MSIRRSKNGSQNISSIIHLNRHKIGKGILLSALILRWPIVIYGAKTWVLNKGDNEKLEVWERRVTRKSYRGRRADDGWERRSNSQLLGKSTISQWPSLWKNGSRMTKMVARSRILSTRMIGRPRTGESIQELFEKS